MTLRPSGDHVAEPFEADSEVIRVANAARELMHPYVIRTPPAECGPGVAAAYRDAASIRRKSHGVIPARLAGGSQRFTMPDRTR